MARVRIDIVAPDGLWWVCNLGRVLGCVILGIWWLASVTRRTVF